MDNLARYLDPSHPIPSEAHRMARKLARTMMTREFRRLWADAALDHAQRVNRFEAYCRVVKTRLRARFGGGSF